MQVCPDIQNIEIRRSTHLGRLLFRLARYIVKELQLYAETEHQLQINGLQAKIICHLAEATSTTKHLADSLGITKQGISKSCRPLIDRGLLVSKVNTNDRRSRYLACEQELNDFVHGLKTKVMAGSDDTVSLINRLLCCGAMKPLNFSPDSIAIILASHDCYRAFTCQYIRDHGYPFLAATHIQSFGHVPLASTITTREIVRRSYLSKQGVGKAISDLCQQQILTKKTSSVDRRASLISFGPEGLQMMSTAMAAIDRVEDHYRKKVGPRQFLELKSLLKATADSMGC